MKHRMLYLVVILLFATSCGQDSPELDLGEKVKLIFENMEDEGITSIEVAFYKEMPPVKFVQGEFYFPEQMLPSVADKTDDDDYLVVSAEDVTEETFQPQYWNPEDLTEIEKVINAILHLSER